MQRIFYGAGLVVAALLLSVIFFNAVNSGVDVRRVALANDLATLNSEWKLDEGPIVSPSAVLEASITEKPAVWRQLIPRPARAIVAPNMTAILKGVSPTRMSIGDKVRIVTPSKTDYFKVGSRVVGTRIKEITKTHVVFSLKKNGKEYTKALPRK